MRQIFSYITGKTGVGTVYGEGVTSALKTGGISGLLDFVKNNGNGSNMSMITPQMSKIDTAYGKISTARRENKSSSLSEH